MKFMNAAKKIGSRVKTAVQQRGAQIVALTAGATGGFAHAEGLPADVVAAIAAGVALALALGGAMLAITVTAGSSKQARRAV